jgi:hypothetical protein
MSYYRPRGPFPPLDNFASPTRLVGELAAWDCHRQRQTVEWAASDSHPQQRFPHEFPRQQNYLYYSYSSPPQEVTSMRPAQTRARPFSFSRVTLLRVTMRQGRKNRVIRCKSFRFQNT